MMTETQKVRRASRQRNDATPAGASASKGVASLSWKPELEARLIQILREELGLIEKGESDD